MNWYRHHWWWVGVVVAVGVAIYLAVAWGDLDIEQRVMLGSFLVLLLHEAEEWAWPGGEPAILNKVITRSSRYSKAVSLRPLCRRGSNTLGVTKLPMLPRFEISRPA